MLYYNKAKEKEKSQDIEENMIKQWNHVFEKKNRKEQYFIDELIFMINLSIIWLIYR